MTRRYVVFLATCVAVAVVLVLAFAPWAGAFSLASASALVATLAVMVPVTCFAAVGGVAFWAFSPAKPVHFELDDGLDADEVEQALRRLADERHVGSVAREATSQMERLQTRVHACRRTLAATFDEGTMTFDRYWGGVCATRDAGVRTLASVAMRLSSFDVEEYERTSSRAGSSTHGLLERELGEIRDMVSANEALVTELVRLDVEVGRIEAGDSDKAAGEVLGELHEMVEQVEMYR